MFESANSRSGANAGRCLISITFVDGAVENLSVKLPLSGKIADAMNNADGFLDALSGEGAQMFVAKSSIRRAKLVDVPRANQINMQRRDSDRGGFDPHRVLKVEKGAGPEEIRQSYHTLIRLYHPDRIASFELPPEIVDYARAMTVRLNLAYEQIGG